MGNVYCMVKHGLDKKPWNKYKDISQELNVLNNKYNYHITDIGRLCTTLVNDGVEPILRPATVLLDEAVRYRASISDLLGAYVYAKSKVTSYPFSDEGMDFDSEIFDSDDFNPEDYFNEDMFMDLVAVYFYNNLASPFRRNKFEGSKKNLRLVIGNTK